MVEDEGKIYINKMVEDEGKIYGYVDKQRDQTVTSKIQYQFRGRSILLAQFRIQREESQQY